MGRVLPIALLGLGFLALLGLRVAFLIILRRDEARPKQADRRWPEATVIKTQDTTPQENKT